MHSVKRHSVKSKKPTLDLDHVVVHSVKSKKPALDLDHVVVHSVKSKKPALDLDHVQLIFGTYVSTPLLSPAHVLHDISTQQIAYD